MSETAYRFESCRGHFSRALLAQGVVGRRTPLPAAYECTPQSGRLALLALHQNRLAKKSDLARAVWGRFLRHRLAKKVI